MEQNVIKKQNLLKRGLTELEIAKMEKGCSPGSPVSLSGTLKSPVVYVEGTEKVDNTACICYNVNIKYRRCFYDRTTAEISVKSIHGNI